MARTCRVDGGPPSPYRRLASWGGRWRRTRWWDRSDVQRPEVGVGRVGARDERTRGEVEAAHAAAVSEAMGYLTEVLPTVRRRYGGAVVEEPARGLVAAEYRHTTARGVVEGDAPDPQLHSHVVITSAVRDDGRIVAVVSGLIFLRQEDGGVTKSWKPGAPPPQRIG
jgi:TrwC relaxase